MPITDYTLVIDPSWMTGWGVPSRTGTGFSIEFNVAAPAGAKLRYLAWGGSPPRKLIEDTVDIDENALSADIDFPDELEEPCGERTREQVLLEMCEVREAIRKIVRQERLDMVDLGGRVEQYTSTRIKELRDLLDNLQDELNSLVVHRRMVFRASYSKGL